MEAACHSCRDVFLGLAFASILFWIGYKQAHDATVQIVSGTEALARQDSVFADSLARQIAGNTKALAERIAVSTTELARQDSVFADSLAEQIADNAEALAKIHLILKEIVGSLAQDSAQTRPGAGQVPKATKTVPEGAKYKGQIVRKWNSATTEAAHLQHVTPQTAQVLRSP